MSTDTPHTDPRPGRTDTDVEQPSDPILSVRGLKKHFAEGEGILDRMFGDVDKVRAVDGVDLDIRKGETLAVVGESGCGKSTLGKTILNLHQPTAGTVEFDGDDITNLSGEEMKPYRKRMQVVFQDPLASLNPRQTVGEILRAPMEVHDICDSAEEREERAGELIERVGLKRGHLDRYPTQFSGGQQQRIGIARALTMEPDLLIADEPVSALDVSVQAQVLNLLDELQDEFGLAMMFIAHDLSVVRHISDRVAVMYLGEVVERAPTDELFESPNHPYTRSLLSSVPRIDPAQRADRVVLRGTVPSPINPPNGCRFHTRCPVVIPPENWPADHETFRAGFTFRNRIEAEKPDPDAIRTRIESEGRTVDEDAVASHLIERTLPTSIDSLPGDRADAVRAAADAYVAGDRERAIELVSEAFPSPCESTDPRDVETGVDHVSACHRFDDEMAGEPVWPE